MQVPETSKITYWQVSNLFLLPLFYICGKYVADGILSAMLMCWLIINLPIVLFHVSANASPKWLRVLVTLTYFVLEFSYLPFSSAFIFAITIMLYEHLRQDMWEGYTETLLIKVN